MPGTILDAGESKPARDLLEESSVRVAYGVRHRPRTNSNMIRCDSCRARVPGKARVTLSAKEGFRADSQTGLCRTAEGPA